MVRVSHSNRSHVPTLPQYHFLRFGRNHCLGGFTPSYHFCGEHCLNELTADPLPLHYLARAATHWRVMIGPETLLHSRGKVVSWYGGGRCVRVQGDLWRARSEQPGAGG
jgi:hypothetical protein